MEQGKNMMQQHLRPRGKERDDESTEGLGGKGNGDPMKQRGSKQLEDEREVTNSDRE